MLLVSQAIRRRTSLKSFVQEVDSQWDANVFQVADRVTKGSAIFHHAGLQLNLSIDFLRDKELPDPLSLSDLARARLTIEDKPTEYEAPCQSNPTLTHFLSPTAVLDARRKLVCPICTTIPEQPVMIEEGREWAAHQNTRTHRRLVNKANRPQYGRTSPSTSGVIVHN